MARWTFYGHRTTETIGEGSFGKHLGQGLGAEFQYGERTRKKSHQESHQTGDRYWDRILKQRIMGYKKLDEVMELLTDELDGFNKALAKLQRLTKNVEDIRILPDTSEIEKLLENHLLLEKERTAKLQESVRSLKERLASASVISRFRLWLHYSIWATSLVIIGYLAFKVSKMEEIREESFSEGRQEVITSVRGYFDQHPEHYEDYERWLRKKDSVPNHK